MRVFTELLPILRNRTVMLTIALVNDDVLRVNVIPRRKTDKENDAADIALSSPLTMTASAQELDHDFARQIANFSGSFEKAASNLQEIESAHAAAVKALEEERKKELKNRKPGCAQAKPAAATENSAAPSAPGKLVFGSKPQVSAAPVNQSLFDSNENQQQPSRESHARADGTTPREDATEASHQQVSTLSNQA
jgi:PRTRC genetic system protein E